MNYFFYQDRKKWKHKVIPIEISKNDSDKVTDRKIYENHYALTERTNVCLGDHHENFICRRCLNSYTSENMLILQKTQCENYDITTIRTSGESHIHWEEHFHKNPKCFRIYAVFEAANKYDNYSVGNKTTKIFKQNPILNG